MSGSRAQWLELLERAELLDRLPDVLLDDESLGCVEVEDSVGGVESDVDDVALGFGVRVGFGGCVGSGGRVVEPGAVVDADGPVLLLGREDGVELDELESDGVEEDVEVLDGYWELEDCPVDDGGADVRTGGGVHRDAGGCPGVARCRAVSSTPGRKRCATADDAVVDGSSVGPCVDAVDETDSDDSSVA